MHTSAELTARVDGGAVIGTRSPNARVFRGIPYAADPTGPLRFAAPRPHGGWKGVMDASRPGPAVPQGRSRLERVMGVAPAEQSEEHALTANVFAPGGPGPYPVLLWIHGGGFSSGSGGWPWYDAAEFAARHDVVVVTINYRLGALGFMYLPWLSRDLGEGNFGILDQVAALLWVERNIAAFGGDPKRITVGGQSAGALSAEALASNPATRSIIRGVILQSPPASTMIHSRELATKRAQGLIEILGLTADEARTELRRIPSSAIIEAQGKLAAVTGSFGSISPAMAPVVDAALGLVSQVGGALCAVDDISIPVLVGTTRDETTAFFSSANVESSLDAQRVQLWLADEFATELDQTLAGFRRNGAVSPVDHFVAATTDKEFRSEVFALATARTRRGEATWVYQFDWAPKQSRLSACHCIELPFLFGEVGAYAEAPMLGDEGAPDVIKVAFQSALASFVHGGEPLTASGPSWPSYHHDRAVMHFNLPESTVAPAAPGKASTEGVPT